MLSLEKFLLKYMFHSIFQSFYIVECCMLMKFTSMRSRFKHPQIECSFGNQNFPPKSQHIAQICCNSTHLCKRNSNSLIDKSIIYSWWYNGSMYIYYADLFFIFTNKFLGAQGGLFDSSGWLEHLESLGIH